MCEINLPGLGRDARFGVTIRYSHSTDCFYNLSCKRQQPSQCFSQAYESLKRQDFVLTRWRYWSSRSALDLFSSEALNSPLTTVFLFFFAIALLKYRFFFASHTLFIYKLGRPLRILPWYKQHILIHIHGQSLTKPGTKPAHRVTKVQQNTSSLTVQMKHLHPSERGWSSSSLSSSTLLIVYLKASFTNAITTKQSFGFCGAMLKKIAEISRLFVEKCVTDK